MVVLDESQDCSPVRLKVFVDICGSCPKVLAYDQNQSIYPFAQGSLATIEGITSTHHFELTATFRFGLKAGLAASLFVARYHDRPTFRITASEDRATAM